MKVWSQTKVSRFEGSRSNKRSAKSIPPSLPLSPPQPSSLLLSIDEDVSPEEFSRPNLHQRHIFNRQKVPLVLHSFDTSIELLALILLDKTSYTTNPNHFTRLVTLLTLTT